ncbi:MAG: VWA domain-containing protein [Chromatiales bacterium]|nr:VWA domain-containing protein [Chromatiales bacterium]
MSAEAKAVLESTHGTPVPLQGVTARGRLNGLLFELTVEQTYRNTGTANIEAVYTFPVPHRAVLLGLDLEIGARRLSGVAVRRKEASERYEEAMEEGNTAALLEQAGDGLYTLSLGNLLAGEQAVIRYRYAELLDRHEDYVRLCVPTVIAPRYGDAVAGGLQPHQVPGVALLAAYPFSLEIQVLGDQARAAFSSPSHTMQVSAMDGGMRVTLAKGAELDRDFILQLTGAVTESASLTAPDGDGFVSLVSLDTRLGTGETRPVALKLVVDCSGSMGGDSIAQARRALLAVLGRLGPADAVSLTRFGSRFEHLTQGMVSADAPAIAQLSHAVREMDADLGGTELAGALQAAIGIRTHKDTPLGAPRDLLLITDGEVWAVEPVVDLAARSGHRLFVVAVGAAPAEGLARLLSEKTGGAVEFVSPSEDIEGAIVRTFQRMREAPKRIAAVDWPVSPEWTAPLPAMVFSGDTLHLMAGFRSAPAGEVRVTIAGMAEGDLVLSCPVAAVSGLELLPRVAAALRLAALPDEEAAALAERHQLVSRHTSFVVVQERAAGEKPARHPVLAAVPQMLAAGWGGVGAVPALARSASLPQPSMDRCDLDLSDMDLSDRLVKRTRGLVWASRASDDLPSYPREAHASYRDDADEFGAESSGTGATPREVLELLLENDPQENPMSLDLLESLGVPEHIMNQLRALAHAGKDDYARIFVAVLAHSPAGSWLTAEQRAALEGDVFSSREVRKARAAVQRLLDGVTEESWWGFALIDG